MTDLLKSLEENQPDISSLLYFHTISSEILNSFVQVRLLLGVTVGKAGDREPHQLQRGQGHLGAEGGAYPGADLQADPPLLQLAGDGEGPHGLPVRSQARLPRG